MVLPTFLDGHYCKDRPFGVVKKKMAEKLTYEQLESQVAELKHALTQLKSAYDLSITTAREHEAELTAIYENAPVVIALVDGEHRICKVNRAAVRLTDSTVEQMLGLRIGEALRCLHALNNERGCGFGPECGQCTIRRMVTDTLETGRNHYQVEAAMVCDIEHKKRRLAFLFSTAALEINGEPIALVSMMDITQRHQAQKMEAIGTLSGGIAHDFNNILFPLVGFAEMLKADLPEQSPLQEYVDEILLAALRSRELVQQILSFSYKTESQFRPVRLQSIVREVVKLMRAAIPTTINISQFISPECGIVHADPIQIHQIVMNLCTNAFHAMEEQGGTLEVSLRPITSQVADECHPGPRTGDYILLTVTDTGTGMPEDVLCKAFDPYFSTKEEGKGTGLGLSVVRGIVESHAGEIHLQSSPGIGTRCTVYFPVLASPEGEIHDDETQPLRRGSERVMIVDDEEPIIRILTGMLQRLGYRVTSHQSSLEALARFQADPDQFDLLVTDMTMPDMTGIKLVREVKKIRPELPVIICTGYSEKLDVDGYKALGLDGYIMKPMTTREISETVRNVLDNQ